MTMQYIYNKNDEYYTPRYAVEPIVSRLKPGATVWCPFDKKESNFVKVLRENGFTVIHSHIDDGTDFFTVAPPECDYIVSNPPYSVKTQILERLYEIGKPFAMLINMQGIFDSQRRFEVAERYGAEMLWLYPRVEYDSETSTSSIPFQSGYFCRGILGENQIQFARVNKPVKTRHTSRITNRGRP